MTESRAAAAIEKVLVKRQRTEQTPLLDSSVKIGMNDTVMTSRLKNSDGPTSRAAAIRIRPAACRARRVRDVYGRSRS